jgi:8-oxo-dGTP pyrophosphatase MutT (NUDIX family)
MKKIYKQYLEAIMMNDEDKVKIIIPVTGGLIIKEGENGETLLLLIQRSSTDHFPDFYEYPRGKCDKPMGENLIHCLKREIKEETGLDVIPIGEIDTFEYLADGGTRKSICHNFLCRMKDPNQKVKLSKEHQNFQWIQSVGEAEIMVLPDQKKTISKVFNKQLQIVSYPENHFTKNNSIEEYLNNIQEEEQIMKKPQKGV